MKTPSLFSREEDLATQLVDQLATNGSLDKQAAQSFLSAYQKLLKTTKRLVRLSDKSERALRQASADIAQKNAELEGLSVRLSKYLAPQVFELIFTGEVAVNLSTKRKRLTVFFSDLVGFTDLSDQLDPEELSDILNTYLGAMAEVVIQHGGTIDKFIGDGLMVFFGDPESNGYKDDALACVRMAIAMQARMDQLLANWRAAGISANLQCRMGIHTGYCTVGNFGCPSRMDYTIIGSTVNLAARLESLAAPQSILMSQATYILIEDEFSCVEMAPLEVKGFANPVATFCIAPDTQDDVVAQTSLLGRKLLALSKFDGSERDAVVQEIEGILARIKVDR